jgi:hypothetical protein
MNSILQELILSDGDFFVAPAAEMRTEDEQLLDSYSPTIAAVVNRVALTVVNVRVLSGERGQGGGSGFIIASRVGLRFNRKNLTSKCARPIRYNQHRFANPDSICLEIKPRLISSVQTRSNPERGRLFS